MIHDNDKQNQRKHRKMQRRASGDKSHGGQGVLNGACRWARNRMA